MALAGRPQPRPLARACSRAMTAQSRSPSPCAMAPSSRSRSVFAPGARHAGDLARGEDQRRCLERERRGGADVVVGLVGDDPGIGPVMRDAAEQAVGQHVLHHVRRDVVLAHEREGLADRLDRAAEDEVVGELDRARAGGASAGVEGPSPDRLEERRAGLARVGRSGDDDAQLTGLCGLGASGSTGAATNPATLRGARRRSGTWPPRRAFPSRRGSRRPAGAPLAQPPGWSATSVSAASSASIVNTTARPRHTAATSSAARAPASTNSSIRPGVRLKTTTSWPAATRRRAMGRPMRPRPTKPMFTTRASASQALVGHFGHHEAKSSTPSAPSGRDAGRLARAEVHARALAHRIVLVFSVMTPWPSIR